MAQNRFPEPSSAGVRVKPAEVLPAGNDGESRFNMAPFGGPKGIIRGADPGFDFVSSSLAPNADSSVTNPIGIFDEAPAGRFGPNTFPGSSSFTSTQYEYMKTGHVGEWINWMWVFPSFSSPTQSTTLTVQAQIEPQFDWESKDGRKYIGKWNFYSRFGNDNSVSYTYESPTPVSNDGIGVSWSNIQLTTSAGFFGSLFPTGQGSIDYYEQTDEFGGNTEENDIWMGVAGDMGDWKIQMTVQTPGGSTPEATFGNFGYSLTGSHFYARPRSGNLESEDEEYGKPPRFDATITSTNSPISDGDTLQIDVDLTNTGSIPAHFALPVAKFKDDFDTQGYDTTNGRQTWEPGDTKSVTLEIDTSNTNTTGTDIEVDVHCWDSNPVATTTVTVN